MTGGMPQVSPPGTHLGVETNYEDMRTFQCSVKQRLFLWIGHVWDLNSLLRAVTILKYQGDTK